MSVPSAGSDPDQSAPGVDATQNSNVGDDAGSDVILFVFADSSHRAVIQNATEQAIAQCMSGLGFDYVPLLRSEEEDPHSRNLIDQTIGVYDEAFATQYGYGLPEFPPSDIDGGATSSAPAYVAALFGPDSNTPQMVDIIDPATGQVIGQAETRGGCVGAADDAVFGDAAARQRYNTLDLSIQHMAIDAIARAVAAPATTEGAAAWSQCMHTKGYAYTEPTDPLNSEWPDPPSAAEIATAKADYSCKVESGLLDIFRAQVETFASQSAEEHDAELRQWRVLQTQVEDRALRIAS